MLRRRPLMRAAATTAVIAGTATAVSGRVSRRQARRAGPAEAPMAPAPEPVYDVPLPAPASVGLSFDAMEQLKGLAALHDQGVLTDEEFAAQKATILSA